MKLDPKQKAAKVLEELQLENFEAEPLKGYDCALLVSLPVFADFHVFCTDLGLVMFRIGKDGVGSYWNTADNASELMEMMDFAIHNAE